ncbi:MAG: queuosine salvage family protein [Patescibacteria group bacterium]
MASIRVNDEALRKTAADLANQELKTPNWRIPDVMPFNDHAFVSQSFYLAAIDFCFTHMDGVTRYQYRENGPRGSMAAAQCFYDHFGETEADPDEILYITRSLTSCDKFFRGVTGIPMLKERRRNLEEAAKGIKKQFNGDPINIVKSGLMGAVMSNLETFFPISFAADISYYLLDDQKTLALPFAKRLLLWPLVYQGRALNSAGELTPLKDSYNLGPIADSAVPNALRTLKILKYDEQLADLIDGRMEIMEQSNEEIEIRMAAVYAVQQLLDQVNAYRRGLRKSLITIVELDYWLWMLGRQAATPYHFTQTANY